MSSTFPAAIANEPPPLDASSEDEDSEEFRSHCLKLDVPSAEPTPVSTPFKRPRIKPGEIKSSSDSETRTFAADANSEEEDILQVGDSVNSPKNDLTPVENTSPIDKDSSPKDGTFVGSQINNTGESSSSDEDLSGTRSHNTHYIEPEANILAEQTKELGNSVYPEPVGASKPEESVTIGISINSESHSCDIDTNTNNADSNARENVVNPVGQMANPPISSSLNFEQSNQTVEVIVKDVTVKEKANHASATSSDGKSVPTDSGSEHAGDEILASEILPKNSNRDLDSGNYTTTDPQIVRSQSEEGQFSNDKVCDIEKNEVAEEISSTNTDFDDSDDFGTFQSIPSSCLPKEPNVTETYVGKEQEEEHGRKEEDEEDDDFGDFAQVPAQQSTTTSQGADNASNLCAQSPSDDFGDFADFRDCSIPGLEGNTKPYSVQSASDVTRITSKIETVIKSLFVTDSDSSTDSDNVKFKSIDNEISASNDSLWAQVQDFEGSQGLMFKWLNCLTKKHLLRSLNIDNSNIMYHEKWGTIEVPKFAASLVQSPLQPQSCANQLDQELNIDTHHSLVNNNNNNVTDEDISCQDHDKPPAISVEAQEILRQLPDLSYMRANNLVFPQTSPSGL